MITNRLIDTRLELLSGKAVVEADRIDKDISVTLVVNNAAVSLPKAGIYRFNSAPAQLKVFKGEAAVLSGSETKLVGAGRTCGLGDTEVAVKKFETADTDELDHWSERRGELMAMANVSGASSFNPYGGWYGSGYSAGMGCRSWAVPVLAICHRSAMQARRGACLTNFRLPGVRLLVVQLLVRHEYVHSLHRHVL